MPGLQGQRVLGSCAAGRHTSKGPKGAKKHLALRPLHPAGDYSALSISEAADRDTRWIGQTLLIRLTQVRAGCRIIAGDQRLAERLERAGREGELLLSGERCSMQRISSHRPVSVPAGENFPLVEQRARGATMGWFIARL